MTLNSDLIKMVDERIAASIVRRIASGTATTETVPGSNVIQVMFDGSSQSVPVKVHGNLYVRESDRVSIIQFGKDWVVVGTFGRYEPFSVDTPANRDLLFPNPPIGRTVYVTTYDELLMWNGTDWVSVKMRVKKKLSPENRTSTAFAADSELVLPIEANSQYEMFCRLIHEAPAANDIKTRWNFPSDASGQIAVQEREQTLVQTSIATGVTGGVTGTYNHGGQTPTWETAWYSGSFATVSAGQIVLDWGQLVAGGTSTILGGSALYTWKIG